MPPSEDILARIVGEKRREVVARKAGTPLATLLPKAAPTTRSLRESLGQGGTRFILEHKRASPSKGAIRIGGDPRDVAKACLGAADAISVLTDSTFFGGSFDDLRAVRSVADVPILCKDFVVDSYQIVEARTHGADAVLLMMSVLSDGEARTCLEEARKLAMDALVEVHDAAELRRAVSLGASIVGINNRNLRTLGVDLTVTERLAPLVPNDMLVVAESGIESRRDVERLAPFANAFLVGSSLMRAPDVRNAARALVFGRVKICGLTSVPDAKLAALVGATFGGLVFARESPRLVSDRVAEKIACDVTLPLVGVFVNEKVDRVAELARALSLTAVQLHGDEDAAFLCELRSHLPDTCAIWRVSRVGSTGARLDETALCDRIVFDTASAEVRGGTGRTFDWDLVASHTRIGDSLVAGGIGPENAVRARAVGAYAIDVGSRVESSQGQKDATALYTLFKNLRGQGRRLPGAPNAHT